MDYIIDVGEDSIDYQFPANIILYDFIITLFRMQLVRMHVLVCVKMCLYVLLQLSKNQYWHILGRVHSEETIQAK